MWPFVEIVVELLQYTNTIATLGARLDSTLDAACKSIALMQFHLPGIMYFDHNKWPVIQPSPFQPEVHMAHLQAVV